MPNRELETLRAALTTLGEVLGRRSARSALQAVAEDIDLPDELWIAVRLAGLPDGDQRRLRDFLLVHSDVGTLPIGTDKLALLGRETA